MHAYAARSAITSEALLGNISVDAIVAAAACQEAKASLEGTCQA